MFGNIEIEKEDVALIIVVNEIIVLTAIIVLYNLLVYMMKDFASNYDA